MERLTREWIDIENFVGHEFPMFLKLILWKSGYDSMISIKEISSAEIAVIEKHIEKKKNEILSEILLIMENAGALDDSVHIYEEQEVFLFLPGHRNILLSLRKNIENMQASRQATRQPIDKKANKSDELISSATEEYTVVLTEFLKTAKINSKKSKHAYQYSDIVKYFSTYIFLLCGRTCYETLNKNLPMPSTKTICKYFQISSKNMTCSFVRFFLHLIHRRNKLFYGL